MLPTPNCALVAQVSIGYIVTFRYDPVGRDWVTLSVLHFVVQIWFGFGVHTTILTSGQEK